MSSQASYGLTRSRGCYSHPNPLQGLGRNSRSYREAAAQDGFPAVSEDRMEQPMGIIWRPGHREARLEVSLVPVIPRLSATDWPGTVDNNRIDEVLALRRCGKALVKIRAKRNGRLHFN